MLPFLNSGKKVERRLHNVEEMVQNIQQGDFALREQFIIEYKPFILKCVSKYTLSFHNADSSDEYSIALIAFNEAINSYNRVKGMVFLGFAELVIRNRLNDNARKNRNQRNVVPFVSLEQTSQGEESFEISSEDPSFKRLEVREEITAFTIELNNYGITFSDLIRLSPKHKDTRKRLIYLASIIFNNDNLVSKLRRTKGIPIKELLELTPVCRGTIEQHRKYIIALVLILDSNLETLKSYIDHTAKGGELNEN